MVCFGHINNRRGVEIKVFPPMWQMAPFGRGHPLGWQWLLTGWISCFTLKLLLKMHAHRPITIVSHYLKVWTLHLQYTKVNMLP